MNVFSKPTSLQKDALASLQWWTLICTTGIDEVCITLLDVLSCLDEIKVCVDYHVNGSKANYYNGVLEKDIVPIYKIFP